MDVKCHKCGEIYSCNTHEYQDLCDNCELRCACGAPLEEGGFGTLWCPNCEDKWKVPKDQKDNKRYFFSIK